MKKNYPILLIATLLILGCAKKGVSQNSNSELFKDNNEKNINFSETIPDYIHNDLTLSKLPDKYEVAITDAKDRGSCFTDWAFASVGVLESKILNKYKVPISLSEQQIICYTEQHKEDYLDALKYWNDKGPMLEKCTGYACDNNPCSSIDRCDLLPYNITGYYTVGNFQTMKASIYIDGAALLEFYINSDFDNFWENGTKDEVYKFSPPSQFMRSWKLYVTLFGWDDTKKAWKCKNSKGKSNGPNKDGTFWISYSDSSNLKFKMANVRLTHWEDINIGSRSYDVGYGGSSQWITDVNNDEKADLVYLKNNSKEYWVMLSNGNGFATETKWGERNRNNDVAFGGKSQWMTDINGDGKTDLVYLKNNSKEYWVMLSNGTGFETDTRWGTRDYDVAYGGNSQWLTDVNGDGKMDLVYLKNYSKEYRVMLNLGGFTKDKLWGERNQNNDVAYGGNSQWMTDVNGDGKMDLVYLKHLSNEYWVMLSNGSNFETDTKWGNKKNEIAYGGNSQWMADVNGDGKMDLVYLKHLSNEYWVILSNGKNFEEDKKWGEHNKNNEIAYGGNSQWMNDINSDGKADLVYLKHLSNEYWVMLSNGSSFGTDKKWGEHNKNNEIAYGGISQWITDIRGDKTKSIVYLKDNTKEYWAVTSK
jgi:hypothetical protein